MTIVDRINAEPAEKTRAAGMGFAGISVEPDYPGLEALARLVEAGQLRLHVARAFALAEAGEAHRFLSTGPAGKVVLVP